ncbi:tRNA (adenosine(37)-N6)-threonylcarbamoyltransferase complex ATPase subunit type 1 TsaE [Advenella sp. S44]|uniref:tRNA (adenosine(37)-N6)-threonylcarbamoyltransferase complex ATPase subunit type 1 TsaE n=1 Tax=Advenella sp. S44 TaxID=1982755 RepID=UPI000C2A8D47|nr:tRNA (adenosine(37)-N6)-threonylcarbamoyltransferase complex ATPase subunit type 1 TsaE [Advenella sp. S44]PJX26027.1 tRNA (adenosine(37)-N6)-threonylcarbamoyltransferase complex ATPase subunit type 1 TsaE [Advenella sp. S44]
MSDAKNTRSQPLATTSLFLPQEAATEQLAKALSDILSHYFSNSYEKTPGTDAGAKIYLKGDLGAGKTTFVRHFLRAMGVKGRIKSPTYTLLETYKVSSLYLYHFDFYRFTDTEEWHEAGFRENLGEDAIVFIEWADKAGPGLPMPDLELNLIYESAGRTAQFNAFSEKGKTWITKLIHRKMPTGEP